MFRTKTGRGGPNSGVVLLRLGCLNPMPAHKRTSTLFVLENIWKEPKRDQKTGTETEKRQNWNGDSLERVASESYDEEPLSHPPNALE